MTAPAFASLLLSAGLGGAAASEVSLPAGVRLALPPSASASFVVPPAPGEGDGSRDAQFGVDAQGQPWFGYEQTMLFNPEAQVVLHVDRPFDALAWTGDGRLLLASGDTVGVLGKPVEEGGRATLPFQGLYRLPEGRLRLFPSAMSGLYAVGGGPTGASKVYWLASAGSAEPELRTLLALEEPVSAVAGDGSITYVAIGQAVFKLEGDSAGTAFADGEPIRDLAFAPGAGLFYATGSKAGFVGESGAYVFLEAPRARIRVSGDSLLVHLPTARSVLRIEGLRSFRARP